MKTGHAIVGRDIFNRKSGGRSDNLLYRDAELVARNQQLAEKLKSRSKNYKKSCFEYDFIDDFSDFKAEKLA